MPTWIAALFKPVADIIMKRQDRKLAQQTAKTKIEQAKQDDSQEIKLNQDEWEQLSVDGMDKTWKDEYVTVSVVSIFNLIVVGGLAGGLGYPQILTGVAASLTALDAAGVDVGFLMEATILAGLGLSVWKRM